MNRLYDPFGSMQGFMSRFGGFMQNPIQAMLQHRINLPQGMNNPSDIINHLMRTGMVSQRDFNNANFLARQVQNNPMFGNFRR